MPEVRLDLPSSPRGLLAAFFQAGRGRWGLFALFGLGLLGGALGHAATASSSAEAYRWEPSASEVEIHVPKAGLFRALGHEHTIRVGEFGGHLHWNPSAPGETEIRFTVPVASLKVIDEGLPEKDRAEVQRTMLSPTLLKADEFGVIRFVSRSVETGESGRWKVEGLLTIAGQTAELAFSAAVDWTAPNRVRARGAVPVALADFGLKPVTALGGTIRTGKVVEVRFDLAGQLQSPPSLP